MHSWRFGISGWVKATIQVNCPLQGIQQITSGTSSGWAVKICCLRCFTLWILALFAMRTVLYRLVLPVWDSTFGHIADGIPSSATTLVSVRNTLVFRTALTALMEHRTHWRRNTGYPSPRRRVALHTYLLYCVVMYTHHQNNTCVTLLAVAAVMLKLFTQRLAMYMSFSGRRFFGNAAVAPGNHSYNLLFNDFQNLCIQFVFSSRYLCIYIATYLHLHYPWISVHPLSLIIDVLGGHDRASWDMHFEAEIEWTQRGTWRPGSSELRDALGGRDCANLEAVIERAWRYTWWLSLSEFGDALGGRNRASLEIHMEAVIERVWRCTWRPWSGEIGRVLGGGRWTARPVLRLYSSVSSLATVGMWQCDLTFELSWRAGWWRSIM